MAWKTVTADIWKEIVSDYAENLPDNAVSTALNRYQLVPSGIDTSDLNCAVHEGALSLADDFAPTGPVTAVIGDLTVAGGVSVSDPATGDGNATLVVFGDLLCESLRNDWASTIFVTGNCLIRDWVYTAFEDSSLSVGGDFVTDIFVGLDIWVEAGGKIQIECGDGYGTALGANDHGLARRVHPRTGIRELAKRLRLTDGGDFDEYQIIETLERRLYETGSIYPS